MSATLVSGTELAQAEDTFGGVAPRVVLDAVAERLPGFQIWTIETRSADRKNEHEVTVFNPGSAIRSVQRPDHSMLHARETYTIVVSETGEVLSEERHPLPAESIPMPVLTTFREWQQSRLAAMAVVWGAYQERTKGREYVATLIVNAVKSYVLFLNESGDILRETEAPPPKLGFYLVDWVAEEIDVLRDRPDAYSRFIVHNVDQEFILENSKIRGAPFLTDKDIEKYCWLEQRLLLTPEGERRWNETGGAYVSLLGRPFVVVVDGTPCYGAMVWNPASSASTRLPQFWSLAHEGKVAVRCCFYPSDEDPPLDVRFDPRVEEALLSVGKLVVDCEEEK